MAEARCYAARLVHFRQDTDSSGQIQGPVKAPGYDAGLWNSSGLTGHAQSFNPRRWAVQGAIDTISTFRNRQYDPATGKWLQEDPAGVGAGANLYEYNGNNPNSSSDPFGLCPDKNDPSCTIGAQIGENIGAGIRAAITAAGNIGSEVESGLKSFGKELAVQLGIAAVTGGAGNVEEAGIEITAKAVGHITTEHFGEAALAAGEKSVFNAGESLVGLVRGGEAVASVRQAGGNFERIVDAGRDIGIERGTKAATSIYTIVTDAANKLVTMFPGRP